jgi:hypothetical protein
MKDENKPFNDVIDHFNKIEGILLTKCKKKTPRSEVFF